MCLVTSLLMVLAHFDAAELPGCGTASDCTRAAQSRWGRLPETQWPLSFVGFAYFQALAAALLVSGGRLPRALLAVALIGGIISFLLVSVMIVADYLCGYCLTIHAANVTFVVALLRPKPAATNTRPAAATACWFAATFAVTSLLLCWLNQQTARAAAESIRSRLETAVASAQPSREQAANVAPGRYVLGPSSAKVHVTVVSDYQCPSCRRIDEQVRAMTAGRDDVAISVRHFPFCTDCNEHIDKTRHPSACRAAVAAEAAGIVGGAEAFWKMHDWLFDCSGQFTDDEALEFVRDEGIDEAGFRAALASEATLGIVRADADAADAAGLKFTPMVFINGVAVDVGH